MASTIPVVDRVRLGCVSPEVATAQLARGLPDAYLANTLAAVADAAIDDIEALQEGGAGASRHKETITFDTSGTVAVGTITVGNTTSTNLGNDTSFDLHTYDFSFPASWTGGAVTLTSIAPDGTSQTEVKTTPDGGGGVVHGSKVVMRFVSLACATAASGTFELQVGDRLCCANAPVTEFLGAWSAGSTFLYPIDPDLTNGTCAVSLTDGGAAVTGLAAGSYAILYTA